VKFNEVSIGSYFLIEDRWFNQFINKKIWKNMYFNMDLNPPLRCKMPESLVNNIEVKLIKEKEFKLGDKERLKRYIEYRTRHNLKYYSIIET